MDTSESSDDDKTLFKPTKLKIADEVESNEHSSEEEKVSKESINVVADKTKKRKKSSGTSKKKKSRPKPRTSTTTTDTERRPRKKTAQTGLNGNYWNNIQYDRHAHTNTLQQLKSDTADDDFDDETISLSDKDEHGKLEMLLNSSSSASSVDSRTLLYSNRTFVTCRSPEDSFFLCQVMQDVYHDTKKIRIRWCALVDENGDETKIDENTHFKFDYEDTLDPNAILTSIPNVIRYSDKSISLKKEDIFETKRLLEKSIRGEPLSSSPSSEEPTVSTFDNNKTKENVKSSSVEEEISLEKIELPPTKEKTVSSKNTSHIDTTKKRSQKINDEAAPVKKRRRTKELNESTDKEKTIVQRKNPAKPTTTPKAQLFKVQSNRLLKENLTVETFRRDPFFEDNLPVPFISAVTQSKLAIRAVIINDAKLLKSLIDDVDRVCSVHVKRGLHNDLAAIHYAVKTDNLEMLKILNEDLKAPKKNRCPLTSVTMMTQSTGRANTRSFGFRGVQITAARGSKEGNNALNRDQMQEFSSYNMFEIVQYALKNNCSKRIYDYLMCEYPNLQRRVYDNIFHIVRAGHRKLAANIIGGIKDNGFYGFNNIHHQVLLCDNEEIIINRATSVTKKTKDNFQLTPIHCAAINPNSKYLKQLLNIVPEYNILDKYERRPIHFAAACEGPEPLEYLLSKGVNFNDVDRGGNSPLHIAAMNGRAICAEILLRTAKEKAESNDAEDQLIHQKFGLASINRMNKVRFYPLHLAVLNNHLECVKVLLEFGAHIDILTSNSSGKMTPLMLASQKGHFKIVTYLIENGAKVEARDRFKRTPLIHACMCGNAHIVSHLLRMGANANSFDSSLNTALHYATAYGWYFCVKLLIESGANVNSVNSWQTSCLAAGFLKGHYGLCDYLLTEHHVDINFKTEEGLTLVMLTVGLEISNSSTDQLDYVAVQRKADCTCVDAYGNNAFHYLAANVLGHENKCQREKDKILLHDNLFKMAQILLEKNCDPNKMNSKAQTPLMIALEAGNYVLVDYLINKAKVKIQSDISQEGKTLLHYFATKCDEFDLVQTLTKIPINDEIRNMGKMFDNNGRTPFHYCASKFNEFCQKHKSSTGTDELQKQYKSIARVIEYCLDQVQCDPDAEIKPIQQSFEENLNDDNDDEQIDQIDNRRKNHKLKETSIFSLLRTVSFIDQTVQHPLEFFIKKSQNLNVLHHETQRTPLLEAIFLKESQTACLLINQSSCNINLATSIVDKERQQTPLIFACRLQLLSIVRELLNHRQCHLLEYDYQHNQAIHYYLSTSIRSKEYIKLLNTFIENIKLINSLNIQGKYDRTPLHIAAYHNSGTIDSITDAEQVLIDNGCDLLMKDKLGNIPLHNIFLNKNEGDDPAELCVLLTKSMKNKSLDVQNNDGNTPLHLAVMKCATVCIMHLQQQSASLAIENKLSNSIIASCVALNHLNLFVTFLQQSNKIDLAKLYTSLTKPNDNQTLNDDIWIWKYADKKQDKNNKQFSLIFLIIQQDWPGALSLILNELDRFSLSYIQILEAAILNNELNLVLRLLLRIKDNTSLHERNIQRQNLYHLLANMTEYDEHLYKEILSHLHEYQLEWNISDKYGSYPLHYACVKQNFTFINFLREKYSVEFNLNQHDAFGNTPIGLFFWHVAPQTSLSIEKLSSFITSSTQLDCLCNYDNESAMNPASFGYIDQKSEKKSYPPMRSDSSSTNVRTSPLIQSVVHNNFALVKLILQLNANVNFPDEEKRTPLMHAVRQNNIDIVKLLLNKDYIIKTNEKNSNGLGFISNKSKAPIFFLGATTTTVIEQNKDELVEDKFQKTSSIDLNACDSLGRTCIHHLVQPFHDGTYANNIELLRLLHSFGASLTMLDLAGLSPCQYAVIIGCQYLCDELKNLIGNQTESIEAAKEDFYINDPDSHLLANPPNYYADAQEYIDKYLSTHPSRKHNRAYEVDRFSGMSLTGEVLTDPDKNEPYDARLTRIDASYGIYGLYNFYRMQIIKHKSKTNLYFLFTRWGRIGDDEGQYQLTPFPTLDECRKEFVKVFRDKTANNWKDRDEFESKPKKYTLVKLNERVINKHSNVPIDFNYLLSENEHPPSKLQSSQYKAFLQTLINRRAIRTNIDKTQLDIEWMPISQLKNETLKQAQDLLMKLRETIEKKQQIALEYQRSKSADHQNQIKLLVESIYEYTNQFYTLIPLRGYADDKLPIIETENIIKKYEKIIDDLVELELSYKILLGAQAKSKTISPLDYIYKSMNCQFEIKNKDDMDSQLILRYIWASSPDIKVEKIFKIARPNEEKQLNKTKIDNHYFLWHGTNICNLISILTRGLLIAPLSATSTGSLFGKGIYTADTFAKSLSYCSGVQQSDGEHCFMILCEVALGKIKEIDGNRNSNDDYTKPLDLNEFQSRMGCGRNIPDPRYTVTANYGVRMPLGTLINNPKLKSSYCSLNYNEYIVYDEAQVALRYLIQFRR